MFERGTFRPMTDEARLLQLARARQLLASGYVRQVRQAAGLTLRECAQLAGTTHVALLRWERGAVVPRRRADAAVAYVALIEQVALGGHP
jgi:DNA-binding transcriptional regulator YiaG